MANLIESGSLWSPAGFWDGAKFVFISVGEDDAIQFNGAVNAGDVISFDIDLVAISSWGEPRIDIVVNGGILASLPQPPDLLPRSYTSPPLPAGAVVRIEIYAAYGSYGHELTLSPYAPPLPVFESTAFVYTMNRTGQVGAWSRYVFPFEIDATAQLGETLFLRSGDSIYRVTEDATTDAGTPVEGIVQWPWLDFGTPGVTKMLQSLDVVGEGPGNVSLQVGYDQRSVEAFTPAYTIPIDTLTGMPVPIPVSAPTLSVRLTFTGKWSLQAVNVNLAENRRTT